MTGEHWHIQQDTGHSQKMTNHLKGSDYLDLVSEGEPDPGACSM